MSQSRSILLLGGSQTEASRLKRLLDRHFLLVELAADFAHAGELLQRCRFDRLVLIDPTSPWNELRSALGACDALPPGIVLITGSDEAPIAIEAMRDGVDDVLLRPFTNDEFVTLLGGAVRSSSRASFRGSARVRERLVGKAPGIAEVRTLLERAGPTTSHALIEGEPGTGKALVARLLHEQSGHSGAFVRVDCGALSAGDLMTVLFGAAEKSRASRGRIEAARGGTLFLADVDAISAEVALRLARLLEHETNGNGSREGKALPEPVRIVASSRYPIATMVRENRFREELYYRLSAVHVVVPPLRTRGEDIALLASHFMQQLAADMAMTPVDIGPAQREALEAHDWPGNVRELHSVMERMLLLGKLPEDFAATAAQTPATADYPLDWSLEEVKLHHMQRVLDASGGNKTVAARRLGVSCRTLERRLGQTTQGPGRKSERE